MEGNKLFLKISSVPPLFLRGKLLKNINVINLKYL